jgi:hypothetical protein
MAILTDAARYTTDHCGNLFKCPICLPLYNSCITGDATTVDCVPAESDSYASFEAAKLGAATKFLCKTINEVWFNNLTDTDTFYMKVAALEIISFLEANSGELHAINVISLCTNMHQYYVQTDGIPQNIIMLEGAQKKA